MLEFTPEIAEEIALNLRKTRSVSRTQKNLGYPIKFVLMVADQENQPRPYREEKYGGMGPPNVRPFFIARKKAWAAWNNDHPEIAKARSDYEAGTHEMITGYDGEWALLYSIPRRVVATGRDGYFLPENTHAY